MPKQIQESRCDRQNLATDHDRWDGRRRSNDRIIKSVSCSRLAGDHAPMSQSIPEIKTPPRHRPTPTPSRSSESVADPDNWRQKSEEQKEIERQMRQQMEAKGAKPHQKRGKKCRGKAGDGEKEESKDVRAVKQRGSKPSDQLITVTQDATKQLEPQKKGVKSQKSEKKWNSKKDNEKEEEKEVKHRKLRGSKYSQQLKEEKKEEAKDVRSPKQRDNKASHDNTFMNDGDERSDLQKKKKKKKTRQNHKQQPRVKDDLKSGVEGRPPYLDDRDLDFVTSHIAESFHFTNGDSDFGLGDATHFGWSESS